MLAALTGLRRGDLLRLSWNPVGKLAWDKDSVDRIIRRHVKRDALLRDMIRRMDRNDRRTKLEKSAGKI